MKFKLTTKGTMTFLTVKAFGFYLNASWGRSKPVKVPMPKAPQLVIPEFNYMGWTPEGYAKAMTCQTFAALNDAMWDITTGRTAL